MATKPRRPSLLAGLGRNKPPTKTAGSPSSEELTSFQAHSSSSPPELLSSSVSSQKKMLSETNSPWDMSAIEERKSQRSLLKFGDRKPRVRSAMKAQHVATSAGTSRLNRILHQPSEYRVSYVPEGDEDKEDVYEPHRQKVKETLKDVNNAEQVGRYVAKVVMPPLKVDPRSIGGALVGTKKAENLTQECLVSMQCKNFETTGERISAAALVDPAGYGKHRRSLGFGGAEVPMRGSSDESTALERKEQEKK
jgi:hypothetical protein